MSDQGDRIIDELAATAKQLLRFARAVADSGLVKGMTDVAEEIASSDQKAERCAGDGTSACALASGHEGPHRTLVKVDHTPALTAAGAAK